MELGNDGKEKSLEVVGVHLPEVKGSTVEWGRETRRRRRQVCGPYGRRGTCAVGGRKFVASLRGRRMVEGLARSDHVSNT